MSCRDLMIENPITVTENQKVSEVLKLFNKHEIRSVPVVNDDGELVGMYSLFNLINSILPVSANLGDDITHKHDMGISLAGLGDASMMPNRLKKELDIPVNEFMNKKPAFVSTNTEFRECVNLLSKFGSPLPVVEDGSKKLVGIITSQEAVIELTDMMENLD